MFTLVAFVIAVVAQEFWPRRVGSARDDGGAAAAPRSVRLVARNRRRYGGYIVHAGIAILFLGRGRVVGVPASATCACAPGRRPRLDGYQVTVRAPHRCRLERDSPAPGRRSRSAPCCDVQKGGKRYDAPERQLLSRHRTPTRG